MGKRRASIFTGGEGGEGYLGYPSPGSGLGFIPTSEQYFIDTTDFGFDQGDFSIQGGEGVSLASAGALSSVWAYEAVGSWVCFCLF